LVWLGTAGLACADKHAENPHAILGDWASHNGVEATEKPGQAQPAAPAVVAATREQCRAATRRIEELALEIVVKEEPDPAERAKLEKRRQAEVKSERMRMRIDQGTEDCLARGTTASEARCIAAVKTQLDIDRCAQR
jgi:hypothetical protein